MSNISAKTKATPVSAVTTTIREDLEALQAASMVVSKNLGRSRDALYRHLAATYIWWREARDQPDFLDEEYKKLSKRKSRTKLQPNFHQLIWLVSGEDAGLTDPQADRYARAIHALHSQYEKHPKKYEKDGEVKLTSFITQSGGVSKVAGYTYTHPDDDSDGSSSTGSKPGKQGGKNQAAAKELLKSAYAHADGAPFSKVEVAEHFTANDHDLSLLLVKKTEKGNTLVAACDDTTLIETVLTRSYQSRFDAMQTVIRPLLEIIQTQCYPGHLKHMSRKLVESNKAAEMSGKKYKSVPRLVYLHDQHKFMLSPMCSDSGVVSLVKLNAPILHNCGQDVFMPLYQRSTLEHNFLQGFDFNLYNASSEEVFDDYGGDNSATHTLRLQHQTTQKSSVFLHFWPFYESFPQPMDQVSVNLDYSFEPDWEVSVQHSWFQKLAKDCLGKWESTHGTQWTREKHSAFRVEFGMDQIEIFFDYHDGEFDCHQLIGLEFKASAKSTTSAMYKTKDWILAMKAVSLLPVVGNISISLNDDVFILRFRTSGESGAEHEIYIPTINEKLQRCTAPFTRYQPELVSDENPGDIVPEDDDPEALADNWPEAGGAK